MRIDSKYKLECVAERPKWQELFRHIFRVFTLHNVSGAVTSINLNRGECIMSIEIKNVKASAAGLALVG